MFILQAAAHGPALPTALDILAADYDTDSASEAPQPASPQLQPQSADGGLGDLSNGQIGSQTEVKQAEDSSDGGQSAAQEAQDGTFVNGSANDAHTASSTAAAATASGEAAGSPADPSSASDPASAQQRQQQQQQKQQEPQQQQDEHQQHPRDEQQQQHPGDEQQQQHQREQQQDEHQQQQQDEQQQWQQQLEEQKPSAASLAIMARVLAFVKVGREDIALFPPHFQPRILSG